MKFDKSVYILGSSGFVGDSLYKYLDFSNKFTVGRANCDVSLDLSSNNFDDLLSRVQKDDVIVFLAAISSPDLCEKNFDQAYNINVTNTILLIDKLIVKGVKVIFSSSDAVFGAANKLCFDDSETKPFGQYGKMKSQVEESFKGNENFFVVRFSYVLAKDDKFSLMVGEHADTGQNLDVFDGFERNVISLDDVLLGIQNIIVNWNDIETRTVNFSGHQLVSRQDIVKELADQKHPSLTYSFTDAPVSFWKGRPKRINTESKYLDAILKRPAKSYKESIKEYN
ncbi:NAD-dependent dehydratase [Vibrio lentus]|uniref:NAD-dependent epimerase/dehydratase family protein n=1 Tax=Vibrio lentus TaxID=136468 RepID=UPI000C85D30B|nr:sugar nucleotide-binding protein [Vibrio lentus]PMG18093.1 NAD-dependent dehydratase [Vibrio lentus]PMH14645.1 NAD-dependent dehydratase [Vibrio lentus]PMI38406.1 NAD-dependent dehydratase [Vibrio lentus]PMI66461.1 NAD-dependent dehydratase [Vibrio lentus]PMJ59315.1 NAD-dependent dehydratase [Vibrio lentus]